MAIPRTGQLGTAALGSLWLGAPALWATNPPSTTHATSALSEVSAPRAALSAAKAISAISAATAKGGVQ